MAAGGGGGGGGRKRCNEEEVGEKEREWDFGCYVHVYIEREKKDLDR